MVKKIRCVAAVCGCFVVLSACTTAGGSSAYGFDCPDAPLVKLELIDVSASGRNEVVLGERLDAVQVAAEEVADCEGRLTVIAWAGSSSASKVLYSGDIPIAGATEIGRDRKIPGAVDKVMTRVRESISEAMTQIGPERSDLAGAFYLAGDVVAANKGTESRIEVEVFTDAITTGGAANINDPGLTSDKVNSVVAGEDLPSLDGVPVALIGVGRVVGVAPPPQDYVQLVQEYASGMCMKTGAECSVFATVVPL